MITSTHSHQRRMALRNMTTSLAWRWFVMLVWCSLLDITGGIAVARPTSESGPTRIVSLVNADAEQQSAEEYALWLNRELAHLVGSIDPLGLEPRSLLVELCNPPGGHYLSGNERGLMRMFREQTWRAEYYRALQRIAQAFQGQDALWGISILSEPAAGRNPAGRQVWGHVATQAGQLINLWLPQAHVVVEPVDGALSEYATGDFQPLSGVRHLVYGFVPSERMCRAVSAVIEQGSQPLRQFDFGEWLAPAQQWRARTGCPVILTGQRPLAPESAQEGAAVLRVRIQSEHGVLAPLEMLVGMPLNYERSIAIAPVEQVSLRERAAQELEQPAWRALLTAPRRVLPVPVDPQPVEDLPIAQADRQPKDDGTTGDGTGATDQETASQRRDPALAMQDSTAVAAREFALAAFTRHAGLTRSPSTLIVRWRAGDPQTYRHTVRAMVGDGAHLELSEELDIEMLALRVPPHVAAERLAPFVEDIDPDLRLTLSAPQGQGPALPNDPLFALQYGLHAPGGLMQGEGLQWHDTYTNADINAPQAWSLRNDAQSIRIAVIDSGLYDHVDFYDVDPVTGGKLATSSNLWVNQQELTGTPDHDDDGNGYKDDVRGWNYIPDATYASNNPFTGEIHGTKVAGIIGARGNSGRGISGVAWKCQIVPLRAFTDAGIGTSSFAITALEYCRRKGFELVNCSWHTPAVAPDSVSVLREELVSMQATTQAAPRGQLVIAAAGNENLDLSALPANARIYPACFEGLSNLLVVGASDFQDQPWLEPRPPATVGTFIPSGSNYSATFVHLFAPGRAIWSLAPGVSQLDPNYGVYSPSKDGTSFAAPHVAGAAALVWAQMATTAGPWNYSNVRTRLLSSVRTPSNNSFATRCTSGGILDVNAALQVAANQPAQVTIEQPPNDPGSPEVQRLVGEPIVFTMSATDPDTGVIPAVDTFWTSTLLGGLLAVDTYTFTTANLAPGVHVIGASAVEDGGFGRVVTASRTVRILLAAAPTAPSNLSVSALGNTATLTWQDNSTNETSFEIQRQRLVGNGQWSNTTPFWAEANQVQYIDNHGASTYRYRVRARNAGATSAWTPWVIEP